MGREAFLRTERLLLRPYEERDKEAMVRLLCCEEIKKTFMIPDFSSRADAEKLFYRIMELSRTPGHIEYGIFLEDRLIGFLNDCGIEGNTVEMGYVIDPEYWGQGYATESFRAVIGELFRLGYEQVTAGYFEENPASGRVMEKCGMHKLELVSHEYYQGREHRTLYYGIEKTDL